MKLVVKQKIWSAGKVNHVQSFEFPPFELVEGRRTVVASNDYETIKTKGFLKKKQVLMYESEIIFAFTPLKIKENSVVFKTEGVSGNFWKTRMDKNTKPQKFELKIGESKEFDSPTFDRGFDYTITLEN